MNNIKILDCTLRDGGYINDWSFGFHNIKNMLFKLTEANIDVVECGFLENFEYNENCSLFSNVDQIKQLLPENKGNTQYVAMTRFGNLDINHLKEYDGKSIEGIRVTFHENEVEEAIEYCKKVRDKGYKVFVQPVGTTSYTDNYLLKLIDLVNEIKPYAFYIVDTLGLMKKNDLLRMFYLVDNNLNDDVVIGFHSHNNLQLSFSNAQELVELHTKRTIIIDSSVYGMGRGAGNLNTELIVQHLNDLKDTNYKTEYLLEIVDDIILPLTKQYTWGYSVPYYLAAINNCHPNYATYLMNRKTLPVKSISSILRSITEDKRELFDKDYIADLYTQFQMHHIDDSKDIEQLHQYIDGRKVLVVAPGASIVKQGNKIKEFIVQEKPVIISVNFDGDGIGSDFVFFSNDKRFQKFKNQLNDSDRAYKTIITSNIKAAYEEYDYKINYSDYLNSQPLVNDNATLMLLALLKKLNVLQVFIAGFDGFQHNANKNYVEVELENTIDQENALEMNRQIAKVVHEYSKQMDLHFITDSLYQNY